MREAFNIDKTHLDWHSGIDLGSGWQCPPPRDLRLDSPDTILDELI